MNKKQVVLILLRHGQSLWNVENRFTGWKDIDITEFGKQEAVHAAALLKNERIQIAFSSSLKRAKHTLEIILTTLGIENIPVYWSEQLNERCYGDLEGLNKADTTLKYGLEQVNIWRRSFDIAPPGGESLKDTAKRVIPYYQTRIAPQLLEGRTVLVVAHGNSLRALMMFLENLSPQQIAITEFPTGIPRTYIMNDHLEVLTAKFMI
ncbi:2,3-bisphosphoglycerate-dependent phosphoglycerate mutase [Pedobacter panaciterrae]